jgi:hypothetical protein
MPQKAHPTDWDRLFSPNARRRGPVALFLLSSLAILLLVAVAIGARFGTQRYDDYRAAAALTATPLWAEYYAQQTATALAANPAAPEPTPEPSGSVIGTANLRSEPRVAADTVIGLVEAGDRVVLLETQAIDGQTWYRARVDSTAGALAPGTEGWINGSLIAQP